MGAMEFFTRRSPLSRNTLHLGEWFGHQEVFTKETLSPEEISFSFSVPSNSYLDLIFNLDEGGSSGIRFSNSEKFKSGLFRSDKKGKFISFNSVDFREKFEEVSFAKIKSESTGIVLSLNEQNFEFKRSEINSGSVGLRSGLEGTEIYSIKVKNRDSSIFKESFRNDKDWVKIFSLSFLLFFLLFSALLVLSVTPKTLNIAYGCIILFFGTWFLFDFYYWSSLSYPIRWKPLPYLADKLQFDTLEKVHRQIFNFWYTSTNWILNPKDQIEGRQPNIDFILNGPIFCDSENFEKRTTCESLGGHSDNLYFAQKRDLKILLVGSSQSIGAGATKLEDTFFVQLYKRIKQSRASNTVSALNVSVSGLTAGEVFSNYLKEHQFFSPNLILVNLGFNDYDTIFLSNSIKTIIEYGKRIDAQVILIKEPSSYTAPQDNEYIFKNFSIIDNFGSNKGLVVLDAFDFLNQTDIQKSGHLWWDQVHLSSYGQELLADWLFHKLDPTINKILGR